MHSQRKRRTDFEDEYSFDDESRRHNYRQPPQRPVRMYREEESTTQTVLKELRSVFSAASSRAALGGYVAVPFVFPKIGRFVLNILLGTFIAGVLSTLLMQHACADLQAHLSAPATETSPQTNPAQQPSAVVVK